MRLWSASGDFAAARKAGLAMQKQDAFNKVAAQSVIAKAQAEAGIFAVGAQSSLETAIEAAGRQPGPPKSARRDTAKARDDIADARLAIAIAQARSGDVAGARETAGLITSQGLVDSLDKNQAQESVAKAQAKAGDVA